MGQLKMRGLTIQYRRSNKILAFLILFTLLIPQTQCLNVLHDTETVKTKSYKQAELNTTNQAVLQAPTTEQASTDTELLTVYIRGPRGFHSSDVNKTKSNDSSPDSKEVSTNNEPKAKKNPVVRAIVFISAIAILILSIGQLTQNKIDRTKDIFLDNALNMCFKQIAAICTVTLFLWFILKTGIPAVLDIWVLEETHNQADFEEFEPIFGPIFESLLLVSASFLICYIWYAMYLQCIVMRIVSKMRKADNCDASAVSKQLISFSKRWCGFLGKGYIYDQATYLANRFDFIENINNMGFPKIDPGGYYFMEYMRANTLNVATEMLRFPRLVLLFVILLAVFLRNRVKFGGLDEIFLIMRICLVCFYSIIFLFIHTERIKTKLYPPSLSKYLLLKYNTNDMEISKNIDESALPRYKQQVVESVGPKILLRLFQFTCFTSLLTIAICVYLIVQHPETWLEKFGSETLLTIVLFIGITISIPHVFNSLVIISKTGLLIDFDTLEQVWEYHRGKNTSHTAQLIDALNMQAVTTSLNRNGDTYWKHLLSKFNTAPIGVQKQIGDIWPTLDDRKIGVIPLFVIQSYVCSQGLQIKNMGKIQEFIRSFMRTRPDELTEEEFLVLGLVVREIKLMPLDTEQMKILFEEAYGIDWKAVDGINCDTLQDILKRLGLKWSKRDRKHLLDFLSGCRCESLSAEKFIEHLSTVQQLLKPREYNNLVLEE